MQAFQASVRFASVNADQDVDNGQWVLLGTLNFKDAGGEKIRVTRLERTGDEPHNGRTVADAVRLVKVGTGQTVTIDNDDPGFTTTGSWGVSDAVDQYGATSLYTNEVEAVATWPVPNLPGQGLYEVYAWWSAETESGGKFYRDTRARFEAEFERRYVEWLLGRHGGNISAAARDAQMDRKYLYDLAKKHGMRGKEDDSEA